MAILICPDQTKWTVGLGECKKKCSHFAHYFVMMRSCDKSTSPFLNGEVKVIIFQWPAEAVRASNQTVRGVCQAAEVVEQRECRAG